MQEETENKLTTIQTDAETSRKLGLIAAAHERSKAAQLRVLVSKEYEALAQLNLVPVAEEPKAA